jgi:4'-phosphopantetheinyl transferase
MPWRQRMTDEIHVWTIALDAPAKESDLLAALAPDERVRAARFLAEHNRRRFVACRAALRRVLAARLDAEPSTIEFEYAPHGKPLLPNGSPIHFNVSHSDDLAMIAVAWGRPVGIDLERVRPDFAINAVAERFFSPLEQEALRRVPAESHTEAFVRCWTRKEAFIKAVGGGLSYPLNQFDVTLAPGEPARLLRIDGDEQAASRWTLRDLTARPGYAASLAVEGAMKRIVERSDLPK